MSDDARPPDEAERTADRWSIGRRELLIGVPAAGVVVAGGYMFLDADDASPTNTGAADRTATPTPGYGGIPTPTRTATTADDTLRGDAESDRSSTTADADSAEATSTESQQSRSTPTGTPVSTAVAAAIDEYGMQLYGQDDYGGVDP
jgi:hypothetical protein